MEDIIPRPLNIVKMSQSRSRPENEAHGIYSLPFPLIPYRKSSVCGFSRRSSNDSTNSMATAPEQIKVPKRKRANHNAEDKEHSDWAKDSDKVRCSFLVPSYVAYRRAGSRLDRL